MRFTYVYSIFSPYGDSFSQKLSQYGEKYCIHMYTMLLVPWELWSLAWDHWSRAWDVQCMCSIIRMVVALTRCERQFVGCGILRLARHFHERSNRDNFLSINKISIINDDIKFKKISTVFIITKCCYYFCYYNNKICYYYNKMLFHHNERVKKLITNEGNYCIFLSISKLGLFPTKDMQNPLSFAPIFMIDAHSAESNENQFSDTSVFFIFRVMADCILFQFTNDTPRLKNEKRIQVFKYDLFLLNASKMCDIWVQNQGSFKSMGSITIY